MPNRAHAFVDVEEAKKRRIDLNNVQSPYTLWDSTLPREAYVIFKMPVDDLPPRYKKLESDPRYRKLELAFGN